MKVEISRPLTHFFSDQEIDLPRNSEAYLEVFSFVGRGDFIAASLKFNTEKILFKMEIDDLVVSELDLNNFRDFIDIDANHEFNYSPILFYKNKDILHINFKVPIEFFKSIRFFARSSENKADKNLEGIQVYHTTLGDI